MFMTNLTAERINSGNIDSIFVTEYQNTSCDRRYLHTQVPDLVPQLYKLSEQNNHFIRLRSITSQLSVEDNSMVKFHEKSPVLNMQENKNNLQPVNISIIKCGLFKELSLKLTPREVFQHNNLVGWNEFSIHKGKVYENIKLKEILSLAVAARKKEKAEQIEEKKEIGENGKNGDSDEDDRYSDYSDCSDSFIKEINLENMHWNTNGMQVLLKCGFDKATIEDHVRSCCVAMLVQPTDARYWDDLQKDITVVLNDLIHEDCRNTLSVHKTDYMHLLQRWIKKYRYQGVENFRHPGGDPNQSKFPLPEDTEENPGCLRSWIETWEHFDFAIPENGAWTIAEIQYSDWGNSLEIFLSTLKSHIDLSPFDTTVNGEAAWEVIPEDLFANDVMTDEQKIIEHGRKNRANFFDPQRMETRRQLILQYFINKYRFDRAKVKHFLNWAEYMRESEERFIHLCENS